MKEKRCLLKGVGRKPTLAGTGKCCSLRVTVEATKSCPISQSLEAAGI